MALAEARAIWQRTANRCLVQEDAKRTPKLACCSSVPPAVALRQADAGHDSAAGGHYIPKAASPPCNLSPSQFTLCPNSKWWMQTQPSYGHQKILVDDQFNSLEGNTETCKMHECLENLARNEDLSQFSTWDFQEPIKLQVKDNVAAPADCEGSKKANKLGLDSGSSWMGAQENTPWWRTADAQDLALLVAQRSLDCSVENCDLPHPRNPFVKKDMDVNICCFGHGGISSSFLDPKLGYATYMSDKLNVGSACQKHVMPTEAQVTSCTKKSLRDDPAHERMPEMNTFETNTLKAKLLEALCHSQTRAREAEKAAKQACTEKEHVIKLVLKQALQLFAYKQWLQLLQLENMCLQFKNNTTHSLSVMLPITLRWTPPTTRKMQKRWQKSSSRRLAAKRSYPQDNISKYAVVFAIGLGLVGTGFLLGSTIGRMQPTW